MGAVEAPTIRRSYPCGRSRQIGFDIAKSSKFMELMPVSDTARMCSARYLHFPNDPARVIHNADAGLLDRYVQSSKMLDAALLLLMLEAVTTDLVSPSA
jgi:hypothetical protein